MKDLVNEAIYSSVAHAVWHETWNAIDWELYKETRDLVTISSGFTPHQDIFDALERYIEEEIDD